MKTISINDKNLISEVVETLKAGGLIIYPTETVYGVGVDATNSEAVSKLLEYKKRPEGKAISIAVSDETMASEYVEINATAKNIYKEFLPGPVTVISKSLGKVDKRLESEKGTLGIRIPKHDLILEILKAFGEPITATSANSSGAKTPYSIEDIFEYLSEKQKEKIDLIIDAGELPKALPSTVIDTTTDDLRTYRSGALKFETRNLKDEIITNSVEETIELSQNLMQENLQTINEKAIVFLLHGELGAGKTHFTKGIAKALGIERTIKSPTYTYVEEYKLDKGIFYHIDAWRIESKQDLELIGFQNWIKSGNVLVIEWPEVINNLSTDEYFKEAKVVEIDIKSLGEEKRELRVYE